MNESHPGPAVVLVLAVALLVVGGGGWLLVANWLLNVATEAIR